MIGPKVAVPAEGASTEAPIRVMIVDDSAVVRTMIARILGQQTRIKVVASAANGRVAVDQLKRAPVDVVVLDIEMPVMTGLEALPLIIEAVPGIKIIMASTLTRRGAAVSLEALQHGACDFVPKPTSTAEVGSSGEFARELTDKVLAFGARSRVARTLGPVAGAANRASSSAAKIPHGLYGDAPVVLRQPSKEKPGVLCIGSSTGGPQALFEVFAGLKGLRLPVLLTQHMPPHFTAILAEHLTKVSGLNCREAVDGEPLVGSRVFVAPGDFHMIVEEKGGQKIVRTTKTPPENFCRPAVDPMLRSVAEHFGGKCLVVILTGMGQDGMIGGREIVRVGGTIVAQDEPTSVVWGMPGAVATSGLCSAVLPITRISTQIRKMIGEA